jgi:hypothetical protein
MVFGSLEGFDILRSARRCLAALSRRAQLARCDEQNVFSTDTGEMLRDAASGRLVVSAPQFQALVRQPDGCESSTRTGLRTKNMKSGTLVALALDGKPLVESRRFVVKMVTDARNADELSGRDPRFHQESEGAVAH